MKAARTAFDPVADAAPGTEPELHPLALAHLQRVAEANRAFFEAEAEAVSQACMAMARRFRRGGRLLVGGTPASASDHCHVSVEFLHPVLVGKRALPALALEGDAAARLAVVGRPEDIVMGIGLSAQEESLTALLRAASASGMLTIALTGAAKDGLDFCDHLFRVPEDDPLVVQEVQETCYHVLYELVHVFLEHEALE